MPDQYAVIGNPIGHSKSPIIHMGFAAQTRQDISYIRLEAPVDGFAERVDAFRRAGGRGLNVTTPFKLDAFDYATRRLDRARLAGAVNAMLFDAAEVSAENFDGVGLLRDITHNLAFALEGRRILVLGAGGAARGALLPFIEARPAELVIANRSRAKAETLVEPLASCGAIVAADYAGVATEHRGGFDVVVNATSASLYGELPPISADVFKPGCLAYDMVYGKRLTPFLRLARDNGVRHIADGVGMLVEQAAEAFAWWRGVRPTTGAMIDSLRVPLT